MRQLEIVFQACARFPHLPVWVHTFHPVTSQGIDVLMKLTQSHPHVPVIFGHMGGTHWMNVIDFAKETPNAYLDLSACFSTLALRMAVSELPMQCLFSSDAPYGEPLLNKQAIEFVCTSEETRAHIMGGTMLKLIREVPAL